MNDQKGRIEEENLACSMADEANHTQTQIRKGEGDTTSASSQQISERHSLWIEDLPLNIKKKEFYRICVSFPPNVAPPVGYVPCTVVFGEQFNVPMNQWHLAIRLSAEVEGVHNWDLLKPKGKEQDGEEEPLLNEDDKPFVEVQRATSNGGKLTTHMLELQMRMKERQKEESRDIWATHYHTHKKLNINVNTSSGYQEELG